MTGRSGGARPERIYWLPVLSLLVNLAALALLAAYSYLNLRPDIPAGYEFQPQSYVLRGVAIAVLAPSVAALVFLWPILDWNRSRNTGPLPADAPRGVPDSVAQRAANAPLALAGFCLLGWLLVAAFAGYLIVASGHDIRLGLSVHVLLRPVLAGFVSAAATFFATEYLCRAHVWPVLLAGTRIAGNPRLWRMRVSHRLLVLWLAISALPLSAVALTTFTRVAATDLEADPLLGRVVSVVILIAVAAALGGAWLAWLVSRSIARPLESLEDATALLREGRFDTRLSVNTTDEFGSLAEGFNLMAGRLAKSYAELETRNRELAGALDRVVFLEHVKRGLDRFVPETVRRAIEANPEAPGLAKKAKDVTVLFLDIEGYSRLSEVLARPVLNDLVERYFSLYLTTIRGEGGDINETAGDGLMIIFQLGPPEEHARAAVRAAVAIQERTRAANLEAGEGHPAIVVNIGISSGECDVGATRLQGPAGERWTFTASGPVTNLAARLGGHARGGQVLLAPDTARRVRERFSLEKLGLVELKNLSGSTEVWEVKAV